MLMRTLTAALLAAGAGAAVAADGTDTAASAKVHAAIARMAPGAKIEALVPSAMPGVYEALVNGQTVYVSADGEFLLAGTLWQVDDRKNLSEQRQAQRRRDVLDDAAAADRIVFAAAQPTHRIVVFTDIDCGYCRKLHQQVQAFNDAGVTIEYVLFPRNGLSSPAYAQAVAVTCADDRNAALTAVMNGENVPGKMCPNPVTRNFELARQLGIAATPTILAADGAMLGGYMEPRDVLARLAAQ